MLLEMNSTFAARRSARPTLFGRRSMSPLFGRFLAILAVTTM